MNFRLAGKISDAETIVTGNGIREIARLRRVYGPGRWRKHKEIAKVAFDNGLTRTAEVHWYEASGIGQKELKIKTFLD